MFERKRALLTQSLVQLTMFAIIPITVAFLNVNERTIWLIFFTISTMNPIFLLGFESSIIRIASFISGGATTLQPVGLSTVECNVHVDRDLFLKFTNSLKIIFFRLSLGIFLVLIFVGFFYFHSIDIGNISVGYIYLSWTIFALSLLINNIQIYQDAVIRGFDRQESVNMASILSRVTFLLLAVISLLVLHAGLLGIVISFFISIIQLRLTMRQQWKRLRAELEVVDQKSIGDFSFAYSILWKNSIRVALVFMGSFLTLRLGVLFAPHVTSLENLANFVLISTLVLGTAGVSTELAKIYLPSLHVAQLRRDTSKVLAVFGKMLIISWGSYVAAILLLVICWSLTFDIGDNFGTRHTLLLLSIIGLLNFFELTNSIYTMFISSNNTVPHMWSSVLTGFTNLVLLFFLASRFSLAGVIFSQAASGIIWNYWGWIRKVSLQFRTPPWSVLMYGIDGRNRDK